MSQPGHLFSFIKHPLAPPTRMSFPSSSRHPIHIFASMPVGRATMSLRLSTYANPSKTIRPIVTPLLDRALAAFDAEPPCLTVVSVASPSSMIESDSHRLPSHNTDHMSHLYPCRSNLLFSSARRIDSPTLAFILQVSVLSLSCYPSTHRSLPVRTRVWSIIGERVAMLTPISVSLPWIHLDHSSFFSIIFSTFVIIWVVDTLLTPCN